MKAALYLAGILALAGCKTDNNASEGKVKDNLPEEHSSQGCSPADGTWAGRMGMRLVDDGQGGPLIDCTVLGTGLVHIGLHKGDRIAALNFDTPVSSAQSFEETATRLANGTDRRIHRWEFNVQRDGKPLTIKPKDEYPGCGLYVFDDCGPLEQ